MAKINDGFKPGDRVRVTIVHEGTLQENEERYLILVDDSGTRFKYYPEAANVTVEKLSPDAPYYNDNPPAFGAAKGWKYGYLPCGCRDNGKGQHVFD